MKLALILIVSILICVAGWQPKTYSQIIKARTEQLSKTIASTLTFSALLLPINQALAADEKVKKVKKPKVLETPDLGIKYIELQKGSGPYPSTGDFIVINYT